MLQLLDQAVVHTANAPESALAHVQSMIGGDSVLLSFLVAKTGAWVWAVDRAHVDVYPMADPAKILNETAAFTRAVRAGEVDAAAARRLYCDIFGAVPESYLKHKRWLVDARTVR